MADEEYDDPLLQGDPGADMDRPSPEYQAPRDEPLLSFERLDYGDQPGNYGGGGSPTSALAPPQLGQPQPDDNRYTPPQARQPAPVTPPLPSGSSAVQRGMTRPLPEPLVTPAPVQDRRAPVKFDQPIPGEEPFTVTGAPEKPKTSRWDDFTSQVKYNFLSSGHEALGVADWLTDQVMKSPDLNKTVKDWQQQLATWGEDELKQLSPEALAAMQSSATAKGAKGPMDVGITNYVQSAVATLPAMAVAAFIPGGIFGKALGTLGKAAATVGRVGGSAGAFATLQAGGAYDAIAKEMEGATEEQMRGTPVYDKYRAQGATHEEAKQHSLQDAAPILIAKQAAIGAAFGGLLQHFVPFGAIGGGRLFSRPTMLGNVAVRAAEGGATMGAQAGAGDVAQQQAQVAAGLRPGVDPEQAARATAGGVIGGLPFGIAGVGARTRPRTALDTGEIPPVTPPGTEVPPASEVAPRPTQTPHVSPENQAALGQALNTGEARPPTGGEPVPPPGPGVPPSGGGAAPGAQPTNAPPRGPEQVLRGMGNEFDRTINLRPDQTVQDPSAILGGMRPGTEAPTGPGANRAEPPIQLRPTDIVQPTAPRAIPTEPAFTPTVDRTGATVGAPVGGRMNDRQLLDQLSTQLRATNDPVLKQNLLDQIAEVNRRNQATAVAQRGAEEARGALATDEYAATRDAAARAAQTQQERLRQEQDLRSRAAQPGEMVGPPAPPRRGPTTDERLIAAADTARQAWTVAHGRYEDARDGYRLGRNSLAERDASRETARQAFERFQTANEAAQGAYQRRQAGFPEPPAAGFTMPDYAATPITRGGTPAVKPRRSPPQAGSEGGVSPEPRPPTPPTGGGGEVRPSDGLTVAQLREQLAGQPGQNRTELARLNKAELAQRLDALEGVEPKPQEEPLPKSQPAPTVAALKRKEDITAPTVGTTLRRKPVVETKETAQAKAAGPKPKVTAADIKERIASRKAARDVERADEVKAEMEGKTKYVDEAGAVHEIPPTETREAPKPSATTTESRDRGAMIEERLAAGDIDVVQAAEEYGGPAKTGRPRAEGYKGFRDYLDTRINKLQDDLTTLDKRAVEEKDPDLQEKIAEETTQTQTRLGLLATEARNLDQHTSGVVTETKRLADEALAKMQESVRKRGGNILGSEDAGPEGQGLYGRLTHLDLFASGLSNKISDLFTRERSVGEYLDRIANDKDIRVVLPEVTMMVRKLKTLVPPNTKVMSFEDAARSDPYLADYISSRPRTQGFYSANHGLIAVRTGGDNPTHYLHALLHEMFHSVTFRYLERMGASKPIGTLTIRTGPMQILDAIARELGSYDMSSRTSYEAGILKYALSNYHELHTMLMTNPILRDIAADIKPSLEFKQALARQGYRLGERENVWSSFVGWVRRVTGMEKVSDRLLDHIISPLEEITDTAAQVNEMQARLGFARMPVRPDPRMKIPDSRGSPLTARRYEEIMPRDPEQRAIASDVFKALDDVRRDDPLILNFDREDIPGYSELSRRSNEFFGMTPRPQGAEGRPGGTRPYRLPLMPDVAIASHFKELFKTPITTLADGTKIGGEDLMENWLQANNKQRQAEKDFRDTYEPVLKEATDKLTDVGRKVPELWRDANLADVKLAPRDRASNPVKPEDVDLVNGLYARYDALSAKEKDALNTAADLYRGTATRPGTYTVEQDAKFQSIAHMAFPDVDAKTLDTLKDLLKTKAGTEQLLGDTDSATQLRESFGSQWLRYRSIVQAVAKIRSYGHVNADYGPLRRYGDYVVTWGDKNTPTYGVQMFERFNDAETFRRDKVKEGATDVSQVSSKAKQHLSAIARPDAAIDAIVRRVESRMGPEEAGQMREILSGMMLDSMSRTAQSTMRRRGIQGAEPITAAILARDFQAMASRVGNYTAGADRAMAKDALDRHVEAIERSDRGRLVDDPPNAPFRDAVMARQVVEELAARVPKTDDNSSMVVGAARKGTQLAFAHQLMSFSHIAVNTVESHLLAAGHMFGRHNPVSIGLALGRASGAILPRTLLKGGRLMAESIPLIGRELQRADWDASKVIRDRLLKAGYDKNAINSLYQTLEREGIGGQSMSAEMKRMAAEGFVPRDSLAGKGLNKIGAGVDRMMDFAAIAQHFGEVGNRWAIALAAHNLEVGKGKSLAEANKYAVEILRNSFPDYGGKARIATAQGFFGKLASPMFQFRNYGLFYMSMMGGLAHRAFRASDATTRREAQWALAGVIATQTAALGALSWMADPMRYILGAYDMITGKARPHNYQNDFQRWLANTGMGPDMAELVAKGALQHYGGLALTERIGPKNVLNVPELTAFNDPKAYLAMIGSFAGGAAGSTQADLAKAANDIMNGKIVEGVKGLLPRVLADPLKAWQRAEEGYKDTRGKVILPAKDVPLSTTLLQTAGIRSRFTANFYQGRQVATEYDQEMKEARGKALQAVVDAPPAQRQKVWQQLVTNGYNRQYPAQKIEYGNVLEAQNRQRLRVADPRTYGTQLPRAEIPAVRQATSFIPAS